MIKFFRRIRQNLLSEGRTRTYLKYAIGEIFLVMVGILLALQVNEWNNERNRNKAEKVFIEQLKEDLRKSEQQLENFIESMEERARASAIVCHAFWKNDIPHDSIYIYMFKPLGTGIYSPILGTAKSLIHSGNISLIKSNKLRNEITSYVEKVEYRLKDISRYEETYFRKGKELLTEIVHPSALQPNTVFEELIENSNSPSFKTNRNDEYLSRPNVIEKVPFKTDLKMLFENKQVYTAYSHLLIAHRNGASRYNRILRNTSELLEELEQISTHRE